MYMRNIDKAQFLQTLEESEEGQQYLKLVYQAKKNDSTLDAESGYEIHHIQPISLGGENIPANMVKLTLFNHCLAHLMLAKIFPVPEMYFVLNKMSGKIHKNLSDLEQITLEDVYRWSKVRNNLKAAVRGLRCNIHNDEGVLKKVLIDELPVWEMQGFRRGLSETQKARNRTRNAGKVYISNEELQVNRMIPRENLDSYLEQGWQLGRLKSWHQKQKGKIPVFRGIKEKHVRPDELQEYLDRGWTRGTGEKQRTNHGKAMKGKIRLCREDIGGIMVDPEDLQKYLDQGYKKGRTEAYKNGISGKVVLNRDGVVRKVKGDLVEKMLQDGWTYGWNRKAQTTA